LLMASTVVFWRKTSICNLRPTNSSGLTGKLGSGRIAVLQSQKSQSSIYFCDFCYLGWRAMVARAWKN